MGWTLAGLAVLLLIASLAIQTRFVKRRILGAVTARANASLVGEMRADRLTGSVLWGVTLHDVELRDKRGGPVLRIDELEVDYSPFGLLGAEARIRRVRAERALAVVRRYPDGASNVSQVVAPGPPAELHFDIEDFRIRDAGVLYEDLGAMTDPEGGAVDTLHAAVEDFVDRQFAAGGPVDFARLQSRLRGETSGPSTSGGARWADDGQGGPPKLALAADLQVGGSMWMEPTGTARLKIDGLNFAADSDVLARPASVSASGLRFDSAIDSAGVRISNLAIDGTSTLDELRAKAQFAASGEDGSGELERYSLRIARLMLAPTLVSNLASRPVLERTVTVHGMVEGGAEEADFQTEAWTDEGGRLQLEGEVGFERPRYDVTLKADELRPGAWVKTVLPEIQFDATGSLEGEGRTLEAMKARAIVSAGDITVGPYAVDGFLFDLRVDSDDRDKRAVLEAFEVDSPYFRASGGGSMESNGEFSFHVDGRTPKGGLPKEVARKLGVDPRDVGEAEFDSRATGAFELDRPLSLEALRRFELSTRWTMGSIAMETTKVQSSKGDISVQLAPPGKEGSSRRVSFDADGSFRQMSIPSFQLDSGSFEGRGSGSVDFEARSFLSALRSVSMNGSLAFEGLVAPEFRARRGRVRADFTRRTPESAIQYELEMQASKFSTTTHAADSIQLTLDGTAPPADPGRPFSTVSARGTLAGEGLAGPTFSVGGLDTRFSLEGAPMVPGERLVYDVDGSGRSLEYGEYAAETVRVDVAGAAVAAPKEIDASLADLELEGTLGGTGLRSPSYSLGRADAAVRLDGPPLLEGKELEYDVDGTFTRAKFGDVSADGGRADLAGSVVAAGSDAASSVRELRATGTVGARNLTTSSYRLGRLNADLALNGAPMVPGEALEYDVTAKVEDGGAWRLATKEMAIALTGTAVAAPADSSRTLERYDADGTIQMQGVGGFGLRADSVATTLDLSGPTGASVGSIRTALRSLGVGDVRFGSARLDLDLDEGRIFRLGTEATPIVTPNVPFFARLGGRHSEAWTDVRLNLLEVGRPGLEWKMPSPGRVGIAGDRLTVESVSLRGFGTTVALDGTYSLEDVSSFVALLRRIGLSPLQNLFDLEFLREKLPSMYRDRLPEGLFDEPENVVRETARKEIEKRIPKEIEARLPAPIRKLSPKELQKKLPEMLKKKGTDEARKNIEKVLPEVLRKGLPKPGPRKGGTEGTAPSRPTPSEGERRGKDRKKDEAKDNKDEKFPLPGLDDLFNRR